MKWLVVVGVLVSSVAFGQDENIKSQLIGKWESELIHLEDYIGVRFEFTEEGDYEMTIEGENIPKTGTYWIDGDTLTITRPWGEELDISAEGSMTVLIDKKKLTLIDHEYDQEPVSFIKID